MKRMKIHTVLLAWCLCVSMAFAEVSHYDGVAAYVNDKVVTIETVLQQMRANFDLSKVGREALPGRIRELFPVVRDLIVDRMLILKAYEDSGAQLPNEAVNERIQTILAEDFEGNEARLRAVLRGQHMTYDAWVKQVREDMIVQAMRQLQVGKKTSVSPKRIRAYYAAHADDFAQAGRVHVRFRRRKALRLRKRHWQRFAAGRILLLSRNVFQQTVGQKRVAIGGLWSQKKTLRRWWWQH